MNKLMVISHERSGTHFLINTLAAMYGLAQHQDDAYIYQGEGAHKNYGSQSYKSDIQEHLRGLSTTGERIIKSHHHHAFFDGFDFEEHNITPVYIYRDARDVMVSCHHYFNAHQHLGRTFPYSKDPFQLSLSIIPYEYTFDRAYSYYVCETMIERWCKHVKPYLEDDRFIKVKYEDLNLNFEETTKLLKQAIDSEASNESVKRPTLAGRSVNPRKGIVGDWQSHLSEGANREILQKIKSEGVTL